MCAPPIRPGTPIRRRRAMRSRSTRPRLRGTAGEQPGDALTVTVKIFAGTAPTGTPVQTLSAVVLVGGGWSVDASALAQGVYTAQAYQSNANGPLGISDDHTFTVDTAAPDTSIISAPSDPRGPTSASFSFSQTEEASTVQGRVEGGG